MKRKWFIASVGILIILCAVFCVIRLNYDAGEKEIKTDQDNMLEDSGIDLDTATDNLGGDNTENELVNDIAAEKIDTNKNDITPLPDMKIDDDITNYPEDPEVSKDDHSDNTTPDIARNDPADTSQENDNDDENVKPSDHGDEKQEPTVTPIPQPVVIPTEMPDNTLPDIPIP